MYVSTNQGLRSLFGHGSPGQPDAILLECLRVFQGDLTCCSLGHPDGDECDFEALVPPALGLLGELYRDRHERPGAWALLKDRLDELFPQTFEYKFESGASAELPLFVDLATAMIRIVDHEEKKKGELSPEQLLRGLAPGTSGQRHSPLGKSPQHRLARTATQRHSPPSSGARSRSRLDLFRSPSAVLRGLSSRNINIIDRDSSQSTGGAESISLAPAPADDLWANSPPGSRTNASTPREVSWTDPEAVERRHITLQPTLPKTPSQEQRGHVHV